MHIFHGLVQAKSVVPQRQALQSVVKTENAGRIVGFIVPECVSLSVFKYQQMVIVSVVRIVLFCIGKL